ncbi:hypothetical protein Leryth_009729 [Lithospermum erythrorhizon]|nr:hypothetical protein Leryth_009729 [Lithospermum erythrorhizon]
MSHKANKNSSDHQLPPQDQPFPNMDGGATPIGIEDPDWNGGDDIVNNHPPRLPQLAYIFPNMSKIGMQAKNNPSGYSQGEL